MFKCGGIYFIFYFFGVLFIIGIKCLKDINEVIYLVILELVISL